MTYVLKAPRTKRLNLECDGVLSGFDLYFYVHRYTQAFVIPAHLASCLTVAKSFGFTGLPAGAYALTPIMPPLPPSHAHQSPYNGHLTS